MQARLLDQLINVKPEELDLLRRLNEMGAASADELAVKLNRVGDDITPILKHLLEQDLLQVRTVDIGGEEETLYLTARNVREVL